MEKNVSAKMSRIKYTWQMFDEDVTKIIKHIKKEKWKIKAIYGIPKGGLPLAVKLANKMKLPLILVIPEYLPFNDCSLLVVDEVSDTGKTLNNLITLQHRRFKTVTLGIKPQTMFTPDYFCRIYKNKQWIVYGWE